MELKNCKHGNKKLTLNDGAFIWICIDCKARLAKNMKGDWIVDFDPCKDQQEKNKLSNG